MTRNFSVECLVLLVLAWCQADEAVAQYPHGQSMQGMSPSPVPQQLQAAQWDYRFDAQFQSTVKPYLRWYMRYDPRQPGNRVLPRDFGFGLNYGYAAASSGGGIGNSFSTCDGDCGASSAGGAYPQGTNRPSLYWNHLRYLRDVYGNTAVVRANGQRPPGSGGAYRGKFNFDDIAPDAPQDSDYNSDPLPEAPTAFRTSQRSVWVAQNAASGSFSILYHAPPEHLADRFSEGLATVTGVANIVDIQWLTSPSWATNVAVVNGRLTTKL